jgi:acyl transferase domain-containing protein/thioesterase domain-containing protein
VNTDVREWPRELSPRRAGVSSFGIGGTNAHAVLEEPPPQLPSDDAPAWQLLVLSAASPTSLEASAARLADRFEREPSLNLADAAFTLQLGRRALPHRFATAVRDNDGALAALRAISGGGREATAADAGLVRVALAYGPATTLDGCAVGELYRDVPAFRAQADPLFDLLLPALGLDLRAILLSTVRAGRDSSLARPAVALATALAVQLAVARTLLHWGITIDVHAGAGEGELAAAVAAGLIGERDAVAAVAAAENATARGADPVDALAESLRRAEPTSASGSPFSAAAGDYVTSGEAADLVHWKRALGRDGSSSVPVELLWAEGNLVVPIADGAVAPGRPVAPAALSRAGESRRTLLEAVGTLWTAGAHIEWERLHDGTRRRRISLPSYSFDRKRFFIEPARQSGPRDDPEARRPDMADAFYLPSWVRTLPGRPREGLRCLVLADDSPLARELVTELSRNDAEALVVTDGPGFRGNGSAFTGDLTSRDDLTSLMSRLRRDGVPPVLVHCVGDDDGADADALRGFFSLAALVSTLELEHIVDVAEIVVVTDHGQAVSGEGELVPAHAMPAALARVVQQELPHLTCRTVDVATSVDGVQAAARSAAAELLSPPREPIIALRGADRWAQRYEPIQLPAPSSLRRLRERGVYLILGGTGTIGRAVARHLAERVRARLMLVQRTPFEAGDAAHDADRDVATFVRSLEELGAEVVMVAADVGDSEELRRAVEEAEHRFGPVNGVVHAAGVIAEGFEAALAEIDAEICERNFRTKIDAARALEQVFADRELDFCILSSSLSPILGGVGFGAYAAANAYLDAFVERLRRRRSLPWTALHWEAWSTGDTPSESGLGAGVSKFSLSSAQGADVFERVVEGPLPPRIVNSTGDLNVRVATWVGGGWRAAQVGTSGLARHPRPELKTAFVAPRTDVEAKLAAIWGDILGIEPVGVFDSFFELGGHSLLALRLVDRLEREFGRIVPLGTVLDAATIERLAELVADDSHAEHRRARAAQASAVLVPLGGVTGRNMFLIHPLGGNVLCYRGLGDRTGSLVYGLQAPGLVENPSRPPELAELADRYLEEVKRVQPVGPYVVGGWSLGGNLAYEVARRLTAGGDEVALTAVVEATPPARGLNFLGDPKKTAGGDAEILRYLGIGVDPEVLLELPLDVADGPFEQRIAIAAAWLRQKDIVSPQADTTRRARLFLVARDLLHAFHRHAPPPFDGEICLYMTDDSVHDSEDLSFGWSELTSVRTHVVPGTHDRMFEEPTTVTALAAQLRRCLAGHAHERATAGVRPEADGA